MSAPRCNRPGCTGAISVTGFCDRCFLRPLPEGDSRAQASVPAPSADATLSDPATSPLVPAAAATGTGAGTGATSVPPGARAAPGTRPEPAESGAARASVPAAAAWPGPPPQPSAPPPAAAGPGDLDDDGLVVLPRIAAPDQARVVSTTARPPAGGRRCGVRNCMGTIGKGYGGRPAPDTGFCPECGAPYSFRPGLRPGDRVGEHYRVLGYLATGGLGWIYLAEDLRAKDHRVVLKGLINRGDEAARRNAEKELKRLTTLHHRDIVSIITHVRHQGAEDPEPTGYIVMEYVEGRSLHDLVVASESERQALLGGPLTIEHVITYGCKILGALEYLHGRGLLYCDMKPDNVIHYDRQIKIIDLGAVREIDDRTGPAVFHPHFAPPKRERDSRGFHVDTDLFTVGRTLQVLAASATPATGLAARSFDRLVRRATHDDPAARFTSAAVMSHQLWEVLREHRALAWHETYPERPTTFEPTAALFGASLGTIPELRHWTRRTGTAPPDLDLSLPAPAEVAGALPVPLPDPGDPAAAGLSRLAAGSPGRIAGRVAQDPELQTVEVALWLCRAFLGGRDVGRRQPTRPDRPAVPGPRPQIAQAEAWLERAARWLGPRAAAYDWRLAWHRGVLELARGQVTAAEAGFAAAYDALPGEWAPKLALGYCLEHRCTAQPRGPGGGNGDRRADRVRAEQDAEAYYEAVWQRDRTQASAAFGLVRLRLRRGDRPAAVTVLDGVPSTSRHYDTARIAAVRILAGRLCGRPPDVAHLTDAARRLADLRLDGHEPRDRLTTELRETAALCRPPGGWGPKLLAEPLFGGVDTARALRRLLHESLRDLARQSTDPEECADLLDAAYAVRPVSTFR